MWPKSEKTESIDCFFVQRRFHTHTNTQPPVRTPLKHYCESGISLCTLRTSNKTNHLGYISIGVSITWKSQLKRTMPSCKYVYIIYTLSLCVMMAFLSFSNHHSFNCYNAFIPLHAISCQWQEKNKHWMVWSVGWEAFLTGTVLWCWVKLLSTFQFELFLPLPAIFR